jgi:hypothetical protein
MTANATYFAARQSFGMLGQPSKTCGNGSGLPGKPGRGRMMLKLAAIWGILSLRPLQQYRFGNDPK